MKKSNKPIIQFTSKKDFRFTFKVIKKLGEGAFGTVYKIQNKSP